MRKLIYAAVAVLGGLCAAGAATAAGDQGQAGQSQSDQSQYAPVKQQPDGMWVNKAGEPTYNIAKDGTVGWYAYDGYMQYSANCMQCHGPDGLGSSYAPNLTQAFKQLNYAQFLGTVAGGKKAVNASQDLVMPSFGLNKNVMCYINPIYVYLRARSEGALGRGRPAKHAPVPPEFNKEVDSCMG